MKMCDTCRLEKKPDQFHRNGKTVDGYQSMCRSCHRNYSQVRYQNDPGVYKKAVKDRRAALQIWAQGLKGSPCVDCGGRFHFRAMHWDHIGQNKVANVSNLVSAGFSKERILEEIGKCDLVCANCHAVRTYDREQQGTVD